MCGNFKQNLIKTLLSISVLFQVAIAGQPCIKIEPVTGQGLSPTVVAGTTAMGSYTLTAPAGASISKLALKGNSAFSIVGGTCLVDSTINGTECTIGIKVTGPASGEDIRTIIEAEVTTTDSRTFGVGYGINVAVLKLV